MKLILPLIVLIMIPAFFARAEWGNLLAERYEVFDIDKDLKVENRTVHVKFHVGILFRVWGQREMDPSMNYSVTVEAIRKDSSIEVGGVKLRIGGENPAFSFSSTFRPELAAYIAGLRVKLLSYLKISFLNRTVCMGPDDGRAVLIGVEGWRRNITIVPEYVFNWSVSGVLLTKEFTIVNNKLEGSRGEEIEVVFSTKPPVPTNLSAQEAKENKTVGQLGTGDNFLALMLVPVIILVMVMLFIRPK